MTVHPLTTIELKRLYGVRLRCPFACFETLMHYPRVPRSTKVATPGASCGCRIDLATVNAIALHKSEKNLVAEIAMMPSTRSLDMSASRILSGRCNSLNTCGSDLSGTSSILLPSTDDLPLSWLGAKVFRQGQRRSLCVHASCFYWVGCRVYVIESTHV